MFWLIFQKNRCKIHLGRFHNKNKWSLFFAIWFAQFILVSDKKWRVKASSWEINQSAGHHSQIHNWLVFHAQGHSCCFKVPHVAVHAYNKALHQLYRFVYTRRCQFGYQKRARIQAKHKYFNRWSRLLDIGLWNDFKTSCASFHTRYHNECVQNKQTHGDY